MLRVNHIIRNVFVVLFVGKVWMVYHLLWTLQIKYIALKIFISKYAIRKQLYTYFAFLTSETVEKNIFDSLFDTIIRFFQLKNLIILAYFI